MCIRRMRIDMDGFCREETPRARKEHRCDLCCGVIEKGERYVHIVSSEDGYIFDKKYHVGCNDLVERYVRDNDGYVEHFDEYRVMEDIFDRVCTDCVHKEGCEKEIATCPHVVERYLR